MFLDKIYNTGTLLTCTPSSTNCHSSNKNVAQVFVDSADTPPFYMSPYFALCQSSGYGKSRLIFEVFKRKREGSNKKKKRNLGQVFHVGVFRVTWKERKNKQRHTSNHNLTGVTMCYRMYLHLLRLVCRPQKFSLPAPIKHCKSFHNHRSYSIQKSILHRTKGTIRVNST